MGTLHGSRLTFNCHVDTLGADVCDTPTAPTTRFFPAPQCIILSIAFTLQRDSANIINCNRLTGTLSITINSHVGATSVHGTILGIHTTGNVLRSTRHCTSPTVRNAGGAGLISITLRSRSGRGNSSNPSFGHRDYNDFFVGPVLAPRRTRALPRSTPHFSTTLPNNKRNIGASTT